MESNENVMVVCTKNRHQAVKKWWDNQQYGPMWHISPQIPKDLLFSLFLSSSFFFFIIL